MPDIRKFGPQINKNKPNGFCIIHIEKDADGSPVDWTFLHANEEMARFDRVPLEKLVGSRFYEIFPDFDRKWLRFFYRAACLGESMCIDDVLEENGFYLHAEAYPTGDEDCCACIFTNFESDVREKLKNSEERERLLELYEHERTVNSNVRRYVKTLGIAFPLIMVFDFMSGKYEMLEYESFINDCYKAGGDINDLIRVGAEKIPDVTLSRRFCELFNCESAAKAFRSGEHSLSLRYPQLGDDGVVHELDTHLVCTEISDTELKALSITEVIDDEAERDRALLQAAEQTDIISALATVYTTIVETDVKTHVSRVVKSSRPVESIIDTADVHSHDENTASALDMLVCTDERDRVREFLSLDTLPERLRDVDTVSVDFMSVQGKYYEGRYIAQKRDENGNLKSVLFVSRDITWEKQKEFGYIEKLRAAAEEADNANLSKTNFLRRMSHDIRTPLNGIIGMLRVMNRNEGNPEKYHECMDKITRSTDYLLDIVNNVLDVSKMETGEIELEYKPFDIQELVKGTMSIIATNASQNSVLFIDNGDNLQINHRHVIGSPVHINRVIMNVASNAIKYNRAGGSLTITCHEKQSDGKQATYEIICKDTGQGMSEEFQKRAFDPYTREGKPTTTSFSGSGLGLSIVRKIVNEMNGSIELQSRENVGTTVCICITLTLDPSGKDIESGSKKPQPETIDLKGYRALLVEDNEINTEIARIMLEDMGLEVDTAVNGREAVDKFAGANSFTYDFIFMDMMMPVMDGLEATRLIRKLPNADAASVPIIAMTANAFAEDRQACLDAGMNDHIGKPISAREIVRALRKFVNR